MDTSLYAWDGRRRGALEMMLRRAINIVQRVIRFMRENPDAESQRYHGEEKLSQLQSALDQLKMEGFTSMDDLEAALNDAAFDQYLYTSPGQDTPEPPEKITH